MDISIMQRQGIALRVNPQLQNLETLHLCSVTQFIYL